MEERDTVGELIALEFSQMQCSREWKRRFHSFVRIVRNSLHVLCNRLCLDHTLVHLDNNAIAVDEERSWYAQVSVPVKQIAENDVVGPRQFGCSGQ